MKISRNLAVGITGLSARARSAGMAAVALGLAAVLHASADAAVPIAACQRLATPGSYVLVANLTAVGDCLVVEAASVTIDLAGFVITGDGSGTGIRVAGDSFAVKNGTIIGFRVGVVVAGGNQMAIIQGLRLANITATALIGGNLAIITGNIVEGNTDVGIAAGGLNIVSGNIVGAVGSIGITVNVDSTVTGNVVGPGHSVGFVIGCPANVTGNLSFGNETNFDIQGTGCITRRNVGQE
jgi:hypothetical protein